MTADKSFKRRVRARAAKTGESYTAALRHLRPAPRPEATPKRPAVRLSVAQLAVHPDPGPPHHRLRLDWIAGPEVGHEAAQFVR